MLYTQRGANEVESEEKLDSSPYLYDKAWKKKSEMANGYGWEQPEETQGSSHSIPWLHTEEGLTPLPQASQDFKFVTLFMFFIIEHHRLWIDVFIGRQLLGFKDQREETRWFTHDLCG